MIRVSAPDLASHVELFFTRYPEHVDDAIERARNLGLANISAIEVAAWCWEIAAQVSALAAQMGLEVILMGGSAVQLRIAVGAQRLSRDTDHLTTASADQVAALMAALEERFAVIPAPWFRAEPKPAPAGAGPLPMKTYQVVVPSLLGLTDENGEPKHVIKVEFHFLDELPPSEAKAAEVFALPGKVEHSIPTLPYQVALKMVTLTAPPIGIPAERAADVPKQLYDLDLLLQQMLEGDQWARFGDATVDNARLEASYAGVTPPTADTVWLQISDRLRAFTAIVGDKELMRQVENYQGSQVPRAMRVGPRAWRCRAMRLLVASRCARLGAPGAAVWREALRCSAAAGSDRQTMFAELDQRWMHRFGVRAPKEIRGFAPDQQLWEFYGQGGDPT